MFLFGNQWTSFGLYVRLMSAVCSELPPYLSFLELNCSSSTWFMWLEMEPPPPLVQREIVFNFPHKPPFVGVTPKKRYSFEIRNCLYLKKHFSSFSQLPEFGFNKFRLNKRKISVARPLHFLTSTQKLKLHDHRHNLHFLIIKSFLKVSFKVFWEQCPFSSWQEEEKSFC